MKAPCSLLALAAAAALGAAWLGQPGPRAGGGLAPPAASSSPRPKPFGAVGCAAQACHGGQPSADASAAHSSANVWRARDPHRHAFAALLGDRSRGIMGNLAGDRPPANAWEDTRCLACHTTPAAVNDPGEAALSRREHGVTCDACHGPAERWDHRHLRWNTSADRGKEYRDAGAVWLNDPVSRAQVCAGCHVGAPPDTDHNLPAREVNHDLIAAGHPRLTFELSLFLANLPPHWDEIDRTQPRRVRREPGAAHTWLAGQLGTAQASLRLLAHQAHPGPAGSPPAPWPELAQLDCYACHHGLSGTGSRPALGPRGSLSPNAWNLSWPLRRVLEQDDPESARGIDQLREALARPTDRAAVAERARGLAVRIGHRLDTLRTDLAGMTPEHVLAAFRAGAGQLDRLDWDDAAQLLYALEALRGLAPDEQALRSALTHPGNADSPTEFRPTDPARRLRQSLNRRPDG